MYSLSAKQTRISRVTHLWVKPHVNELWCRTCASMSHMNESCRTQIYYPKIKPVADNSWIWSHDGARDSLVRCVCCSCCGVSVCCSVLHCVFGPKMVQSMVNCVSFSCIRVPVCCRVCSVTRWRKRFYGSLYVFQLFPNVLQYVAVCVWSHDSALDSMVRCVSCRCCNIAVCCSVLQWMVFSALQCFALCIWSLNGAQDPTALSVCCSSCSVEWVAVCCSAAYVAGVAVLRVLQCIAFRTHDHARDSITYHLEFFVSYTATYCNTLQHTVTYCNTLATRMAHLRRLYVWYTTSHFKTLQHIATHCNTLQHTATHCNTLQHTVTHCNTLQHIWHSISDYSCHTLQHTAVHRNTLQHTAPNCKTLQHIARHCKTLQHIAQHCNVPAHILARHFMIHSLKFSERHCRIESPCTRRERDSWSQVFLRKIKWYCQRTEWKYFRWKLMFIKWNNRNFLDHLWEIYIFMK